MAILHRMLGSLVRCWSLVLVGWALLAQQSAQVPLRGRVVDALGAGVPAARIVVSSETGEEIATGVMA